MLHAGKLIEDTLREEGRTVTWFAAQMHCTRTHIYKIFQKETLDIHLLWRASRVLNRDLFQPFSEKLGGDLPI